MIHQDTERIITLERRDHTWIRNSRNRPRTPKVNQKPTDLALQKR
jgi:hypothetical protein